MGRQSIHHTDTKPTKPGKEIEQQAKQRHRKTAGARRTHSHRKTTKPRREEREAGRQQRTGGERAHKNQRGCLSALADAQWGSWIITYEYLSEEAQSTPTTHTQWCRGYTTPHRATAFDATGCTKSRNKALQHAKRTQGNQAAHKATIPGGRHQYQPGPGSPEGPQRGSPNGWGGNNSHQHEKANKECKNAMVASSKPNSDKFSHSAQFYFTCSSVPEFLQSMGGLEPKYNEYSGMAHSLCSGVRSDMQWAWSLYLNTTPWIKTLQFKS